MTRQSVLSEAPFGEALRQAGPRAAKWLEEVGTHWLVVLVGELAAPNESFETATKAMPARVEVRLRSGETHFAERSIPVGAIGPDTRAHHHDIVRAKFLTVGGPEEAADIAAVAAAIAPPVILLAHSFGALATVDILDRLPGVLLDPSASPAHVFRVHQSAEVAP